MPGIIEISILVGFLVVMGLISFNVEPILKFLERVSEFEFKKKSKH